jgi:transposase
LLRYGLTGTRKEVGRGAAFGAPELNPIENVWEYLAATNSPSPSSTTTTTSSTKSATAWNVFEEDPERIALITTRT